MAVCRIVNYPHLGTQEWFFSKRTRHSLMAKPRVLFLDDDVNLLAGLRRRIRPYDRRYGTFLSSKTRARLWAFIEAAL